MKITIEVDEAQYNNAGKKAIKEYIECAINKCICPEYPDCEICYDILSEISFESLLKICTGSDAYGVLENREMNELELDKFIKKFKDYIDIDDVLELQTISEGMALKLSKNKDFNWFAYIYSNDVSFKFIDSNMKKILKNMKEIYKDEYEYYVDSFWRTISYNASYGLTDEFLDKYKDKLYWPELVKSHNFSEDTFDKYYDYISDLLDISLLQNLSIDFILKHGTDILSSRRLMERSNKYVVSIFSRYNENEQEQILKALSEKMTDYTKKRLRKCDSISDELKEKYLK